jgi:hypothetical protein
MGSSALRAADGNIVATEANGRRRQIWIVLVVRFLMGTE